MNELAAGGNALRNLLYKLVVTCGRFCGLRVQENVLAEINPVHFIGRFDYRCRAVSLAHKTQDLGMSFLSEYDYLLGGGVKFLILPMNTLLKLKHHRACGVNQGDSVVAGRAVGRWGLAVCAQQHLCSVQCAELLVVDGLES